MSEETRLVVEFVGGVFLVFITHYLTKSHYERKRQDDLADRDFNRRATVHDMRIKEAREVVDTWGLLNNYMRHVNGTFLEASSMKQKNDHLDYLARNNATLPSLLTNVSNQSASIDILNDEELTSLYKALYSMMYLPMKHQFEVAEKLLADDELDVKDLKVNDYSDVIREADKLIVRMKARLDKLAQKVP